MPAGDTLTLPHVSAVHFYVSFTTHSPLYQFLTPWSAFFYWPSKTPLVQWSIWKDGLFRHATVSQSSGHRGRRALSICLWTSIRSLFKTLHPYTFKSPPHAYLLCFQRIFKGPLFSQKFWDSAFDLHLCSSLSHITSARAVDLRLYFKGTGFPEQDQESTSMGKWIS